MLRGVVRRNAEWRFLIVPFVDSVGSEMIAEAATGSAVATAVEGSLLGGLTGAGAVIGGAIAGVRANKGAHVAAETRDVSRTGLLARGGAAADEADCRRLAGE